MNSGNALHSLRSMQTKLRERPLIQRNISKAQTKQESLITTRRSDPEDYLRDNITTLRELETCLPLTSHEIRQLATVVERHPMSITPYYLSLIDINDPLDPIRKMAIPSIQELNTQGSYDTSGERENTKMTGLQHKYPETALILLTNRCAMYCRHCFRKRIVGLPNHEILDQFNDAVDYIKDHREINNVLVSGGDPLILPTRIIRKVLTSLSDIEHLTFIRFGTRSLVTCPGRITNDNELLALLNRHSRQDRRVYVVTQFNHPREITSQSTRAVSSLLDAGVIVSNQAVLLRGVNNDPETLAELLRNLVRIGVNPYYIFQCRPVKRVKHNFQISLYDAYRIIEQAKSMLDGHSKRFKFIMSHRTGKIEMVGMDRDHMYFKYHQAKHPRNRGRFFTKSLSETACWLDDFPSVKGDTQTFSSFTSMADISRHLQPGALTKSKYPVGSLTKS